MTDMTITVPLELFFFLAGLFSGIVGLFVIAMIAGNNTDDPPSGGANA